MCYKYPQGFLQLDTLIRISASIQEEPSGGLFKNHLLFEPNI